MSVGLYSRETVAAFLGKKLDEIERMIEEDGLPAVPVPSASKVRHKFSAVQLLAWLNQRSRKRWTLSEVTAELDRCEPQTADPEREAKLCRVTELKLLCDTAETALRNGTDCPRVMRAIADVVTELNREACAA